MVNRKEYRIGNLIECFDIETDLWCVDEVVSVSEDDIVTRDEKEGGAGANSDYRDISLTEEWLLKFGFGMNSDGDFVISNGRKELIASPNDEGDYSLIFREDIGMNAVMIHSSIQYFHQIQNLYYLLFDEELTINDK